MKPVAISTTVAFLVSINPLRAQTVENKNSINLAIELFEAYGAKQNLSNAMKEYAKNYKIQHPSISTKELDNFVSDENLNELFEKISKPLVESFSNDELKYLISQFKTKAFQKVLHPQGTQDDSLTEEEEKVFSDYRKSEAGIKFTREWPKIRTEMTNISKQWIVDATIRAQKSSPAEQPKNK